MLHGEHGIQGLVLLDQVWQAQCHFRLVDGFVEQLRDALGLDLTFQVNWRCSWNKNIILIEGKHQDKTLQLLFQKQRVLLPKT